MEQTQHRLGFKGKFVAGSGSPKLFFAFDKLFLVKASEAGMLNLLCANTRGTGMEEKNGFSLGLQAH